MYVCTIIHCSVCVVCNKTNPTRGGFGVTLFSKSCTVQYTIRRVYVYTVSTRKACRIFTDSKYTIHEIHCLNAVIIQYKICHG